MVFLQVACLFTFLYDARGVALRIALLVSYNTFGSMFSKGILLRLQLFDGRGIDVKADDFTGVLPALPIDDLAEGMRVSVEYTLIPFPPRSEGDNDAGYAGGCTFKLLSIMVVGTGDQTTVLDTSSPSKRRRLF